MPTLRSFPTKLGCSRRSSEPKLLDMIIDDVRHRHSNRCWWNHHEARWVCAPVQPEPTPDTDRDLVDVRDMIVVHTAMLREFRLAPAAVHRTVDGDRRRAKAVSAHIRWICDMLHHHHEGEDELLWPKLRSRVSASSVSLIDEVEAQHAALDVALTDVGVAREAWAAEPTDSSRDRFAQSLERLFVLLKDHLELEERSLLPLAAAALTFDEWHGIGEAAVASMPKSDLPLTFGMFAYEGDAAVLRDMLQSAPAIPRMLLPKIAPRIYARRCRRIHGTSRP